MIESFLARESHTVNGVLSVTALAFPSPTLVGLRLGQTNRDSSAHVFFFCALRRLHVFASSLDSLDCLFVVEQSDFFCFGFTTIKWKVVDNCTRWAPLSVICLSVKYYLSRKRTIFRRLQCNSCRTAGADNCGHCFKYGSTDHFSRGCERASGNRQRLRQWGRM